MITIGINYGGYHDSSACIARDGEIIFATAEERLSRVKHDGGFPRSSLRSCLEFAQVTPEEVDYFCSGSVSPWHAFRADLKAYLSGTLAPNASDMASALRGALRLRHDQNGARPFRRELGGSALSFRMVDHHLAHAISAFAFSGYEDAAVLVVDGRGSWQATSIWHGQQGRLKHVQTIPWPNSLGLFYASLTGYLGFKPNCDEWKVMGLAPYGEPGINLADLIAPDRKPYTVDSRRLAGDMWTTHNPVVDLLGRERRENEQLDARHKNIAFAVQAACEVAMLNLSQMARDKTGSPNLCLAGGVALNSKANGRIAASGFFQRVFVQPAPGDDGAALGAALVPFMDKFGELPRKRMTHTYLGRSFGADEIEPLLRAYKLRYRRLDSPAQAAAELLVQSKIIGWFQGRAEFGPRALGNRSILADPRLADMPYRLNTAVKFREWWRPFAPSMLAEHAGSYVDGCASLPFMAITANVRPECRSSIPAVTHVDGSTRPQTVEKNDNPVYWQLIEEFRKRTGVPVVLNTSLNLQGEPIVDTPADVLRTFFSSGLDAVFIGEYLVEK